MTDDSGGDDAHSFLFARPHNFHVAYEINPYMEAGVDSELALRQWEALVETVKEYADVSVVDYSSYLDPGLSTIDELPDSVFVANHGLAVPGEDAFILSRMARMERVDEVPYFKQWTIKNGYDTYEISPGLHFEGAGDGKWHPNNELLWLGYGQRTDFVAVQEVATLLDVPVISLELVSDRFYHLDVCFTPLDEDTVLIIDDAFTDDGMQKICDKFDLVLRVPESDYRTMAGNSSRIAPGTVTIDERNTATIKVLEEYGYDAVPVDTSEFQKSGGSVDCLSLRLP